MGESIVKRVQFPVTKDDLVNEAAKVVDEPSEDMIALAAVLQVALREIQNPTEGATSFEELVKQARKKARQVKHKNAP